MTAVVAPSPTPRRFGAFRDFAGAHRSISVVVGMVGIASLLYVLSFLPPLTLIQGSNAWLGSWTNAGVFVLLAIGLNVVVGYAGLLDLGYAAFFAFGA